MKNLFASRRFTSRLSKSRTALLVLAVWLLSLTTLPMFAARADANRRIRIEAKTTPSSTDGMPSLRGDEAIEHLKEQGTYDSLQEAMAAIRYEANFQPHPQIAGLAPSNEFKNPANGLISYVTTEGIELTSIAGDKKSWQLGLKLTGYGYGATFPSVAEGEVSSKANRVAISRGPAIRNSQSTIEEWFVNSKRGIEHGFTLSKSPGVAAIGENLRLRLAVTGNWKIEVNEDGQGASFTQPNTSLMIGYNNLFAVDARGQKIPARMEVEGNELVIVVDDKDAEYPLTIDPMFTQQQKLTANDGGANDRFGESVSISGDTVVVGAYLDDIGANTDQGSAYVFVRSGGTWTQQQKLTAPDGAASDQFGVVVSLSGNTVAIGAHGDDVGANTDQGSVYIFVRSGVTWSQQQKLTASDGAAGDLFGLGVALTGDTVVVGAPTKTVGGNPNQGAAYVFVRSGATWTQQQKLTASDGAAGDNFGNSVAISSIRIIVGAYLDDIGANADQGSAYIFVQSGATWSQQQKLTANNGAAGDTFGVSVSISGLMAVIGARSAKVGNNNGQGAAYVFVFNFINWTQQQILIASDGGASDQFATSLVTTDDTIIVGAYADDLGSNVNAGSAYVFGFNGTGWVQQQKLISNDSAPDDEFGLSVAIDGETMVIGAYTDDIGANTDQGSAYVFLKVGTSWTQQAHSTASDAGSGDDFGSSVAISGDTVVVGAVADDIGASLNQGSAYVFVRSGVAWTQQQKLTAPDGAQNDNFGGAVGISGDTLVVGAQSHAVGANNSQGAAYVFVRSGVTWSLQSELTSADGAFLDLFGKSVAIDGDSIVIGAYLNDVGVNADEGAAYVFVRSGVTWTQQAKLTASDGTANLNFGNAIAISGDTVVVGAYVAIVGGNAGQGAAYVFTRSGGSWSQQQKLTAPDGAASDFFGFSVAVSGDYSIVGAFHHTVAGHTNQGAAYVFVRTGSTWTQQQQLAANDGLASDNFGSSVGISGDTVVIGAEFANVGGAILAGASYVFTRSGVTWTQQQKLTASDGADGDILGTSVAISGNTIIVGASGDDVAFSSQGSVYIFVCTWGQQFHATASDGTSGDKFGYSVSINGDTAVVGAAFDDVGANSNQGSAYVFVRSGVNWTQQAKLAAADGAAGDNFGFSVSISGDTIVAGANFAKVGANGGQGAAYVFVRSGNLWTQQQKLTASDGAVFDTFGSSVAVIGDTVVVGAPAVGATQNQGSVYVFVRSSATWTQQAKLTASDRAMFDQFGNSVAISGDTVVVGASGDTVGANGAQGSAYIFARIGATWNQQAKLTASDGALNDQFGYSVAISGDTVVVGAAFADVTNVPDQGVAYIFVRSGNSWTQQQKLLASDGADDDNFGISVGISGDIIVIGAYQAEVTPFSNPGAVYAYARNGTNWQQQQKFTSNDALANDDFGFSVAICGDTIIVGADEDQVGSNFSQGSAYIFVMNCNTTPSMGAVGGVTRQQGSAPVTATVATVFDSEDPIGYLTINVASAPAGISVTNITNNNGTIAAALGADCSASPGNNFVILQVTDSDGAAGSVQLTVIVTANPLPTLGVYSNTSVAVTGSTTTIPSVAPFDNGSIVSFSATSPTFGGSLGASRATGNITIANAKPGGTHLITVTAVDNCGDTFSTAFTLSVICQNITINPSSIPAALAGSAYNQVFTQTGGNGPVSFVLTGALPTGMSFSAGTATLSGTPTQIGNFPITIVAIDQNNCPGVRNYTLTVNSPTIVWNGSTSTDWDTASNWTPALVPTDYSDVLIPSSGVTNDPTIANNSSAIHAMTVQASRVLTINSSRQLTTTSDVTSSGQIKGAGTLLFDGLTFTQNGSVSVASLQFDSGTHTLIGGGTFASNIITVLNGAIVNLTSAHSVSVIVINSGGAFDATNQTLTLTGAGTPIFNSGTFTAVGSTIVYQGSVAQVVTANIDYNNLTINNPSGVALAGDATASGVLNLMTDLTTGPFTLTMPASGSSNGTGDVIGNVRRTGFAIATPLSFGNPFNSIRFDSGTAPTDVTINLVKNAPSGFASSVARTYTITPNGGSGYAATLRLRYKDAELNGLAESTLELWRYNGSTWQSPAGTATRDTTANWVEETGVTQFSPWTIAGPSGPTEVKLISFDASSYDNGILLVWKTGFEVDNLGFRVYGERSGTRALLNREIVAGSALIAGPGTILAAGRDYSFWVDAKDAGDNSAYWLEDLDLKGESTWHGPFFAKSIAGTYAAPTPDSSFRNLNQHQADYSNSRVVETVSPFVGANSNLANAEQLKQQLQLTAQSVVKLLVNRGGFYRVTQKELIAGGLGKSIQGTNLQLFADGKEIPMRASANAQGLFDENSFIEFYGVGLDTPSTDSRTYWLTVGAQPGKRIPQVKGEGAASSSSFTQTIERRDRNIYFAALLNGERENFFGAVISNQPVDQTLNLAHLDSTASLPATLEVSLQGVTTIAHRVSIELNNAFLGFLDFTNQTNGVVKFSVPHTALREDTNTVRLTAQNGASDISLVDALRISYQHKFVADDNSLTLTTTDRQSVTVAGFTSDTIRVFDVTDSDNPQELTGKISETSGSYSITVAPSERGQRRLLLLTDEQASRAAGIKEDRPSSLRNRANAADLVIISARAFFPALDALRQLRESQGYKVAVVDIEDVYDEFSFGNKSPQSVKDFLSFATTNWQLSPRFVMFVGDASYDPRNYLQYGDSDLVPTKLLDTNYLETASDDWFADFNNDGISDLSVGRLPVRSLEEATVVINKLLRYNNTGVSASVTLVSDANDGDDFEQASDQLKRLLPATIKVEDIRRGQMGEDEAKTRLLTALNNGQKLVNYVGHGSENSWRGNRLTSSQALALRNGDRLPFFVTMTCLNGYFQEAAGDSLSEALLKAENGGAIAVWASSGLTLPQAQAEINQQLYRLLFSSGAKSTDATKLTLGELIKQAKAASIDRDIRRTWILLGDPTLRLK